MLHGTAHVERVVPSWFATQLRDLDPNLICYFNPIRQRWVIDRCTRGGELNAAAHNHNPECPRVNVTVVQDAGEYMPLCQQVLDGLRQKDAWTQFGNMENYLRNSDEQFANLKAKEERDVCVLYADAAADNKRQLNEAFDIQRTHDMRPHQHG